MTDPGETEPTDSDPTEQPAIEAHGVHRTLGQGASATTVLRGVSLQIERGEWVAIMGPSGSGKTTLLHALGGLDHVDGGTIHLGGHEISAATETERARLRRTEVAFVFQQYNLLSDLSALDNVCLPLRMIGRGRRSARQAARAMLDELGLDDRRLAYPAELSGGEQQRVALARALVVEPLVLFADEPTGALDTAAGDIVLDALRRHHGDGQTIAMVTHDHRVASAADRVLSMRDGELTDEHRLRAVHAIDAQNLISLELG